MSFLLSSRLYTHLSSCNQSIVPQAGIIFDEYGSRAGREQQFLMGYLGHDENDDEAVKHVLPTTIPETAFIWKHYAQQAKESESQGRLYEALQSYSLLLDNHFLSERMMDIERYGLHVAMGRLLVRMGMLHRAESTFFAATSLADEPAEAYFELARLKSHQGKLDDAVLHYKHHLFYQSDNLESLQNLGCLLVIKGSINEGGCGGGIYVAR